MGDASIHARYARSPSPWNWQKGATRSENIKVLDPLFRERRFYTFGSQGLFKSWQGIALSGRVARVDLLFWSPRINEGGLGWP